MFVPGAIDIATTKRKDGGGGGDDDDDGGGGDGGGSEQSDLCLSAISEDGVVLKDGYSAIGLIIAIF